MKLKTIVLSCVLALISLTNIFAQSGRDASKPTPAQGLQESKPPDQQPKFTNGSNADKYKIIFPTSYEAFNAKATADEIDWMIPSSRDSFMEELNKAGAQGYKVVATTGKNLFTLVKFDEGRYEYQWFEAGGGELGGGFEIDRGEFEKKHKELQQQGFRLIDNYTLVGNESCEAPKEGSIIWQCNPRYLFLYEKDKSAEKTNEQKLVTAYYDVGAHPSVELTTQINELLARDFYPVKTFTSFDVLLEQFTKTDEIINDKPDVQVVRGTWWTGVVKDRVNALAKQGYKVAIANVRIVVMYRRNDKTAPINYVWVNAKKKDFEKKLAQLQEQGAVYRTTYPNGNGNEVTLIFELSQAATDKRREYKVLKFDFEMTLRNIKEGKVYRELTAASKEKLKMLDELTKQGFEARDLFVSSKQRVVSVLLERQMN